MSKIAIVGAHPDTKLKAPYDDPDWTIWSCSMRNESELPRHDAWFEMHKPEFLAKYGPVYPQWLKDQKLVYMQEAYDDIPGAVVYPLDKVRQEIGSYTDEFLKGSVNYMQALAVTEKPEVMGFWGIGDCPEYAHQRQSILFFVHEAVRRGIRIEGTLPMQDTKLYGYDT